MNSENLIYHVSPLKNLSSILKNGFHPSIGPRSKLLGESVDRVYFFNGRQAYEDGLLNWLENQFDESEPLVIFTLNSSFVDVLLSVDEKCSFEITANKCVTPNAIIKIENENGLELIFEKGIHQSLCSFPHHIINHTEFGIKLENFSYENLEIILNEIGCGWTDGGCLIFARALEIWSKNEITLGAVISEVDEEIITDHIVGVYKTENDIVYLDANGLSTRDEMLRNQFVRPGIDISPFLNLSDEIPENENLSFILAQKMHQCFGEFQKNLFAKKVARKQKLY